MGLFDMQLVSYAGWDFTGFRVTEVPFASGYDTCWFPGSAFPPATEITGGSWVVQPSNIYGEDWVGWWPHAIAYYRQERPRLGLPMPCGTTLFQEMIFEDGTSYAFNQLQLPLYMSGACSGRANAWQCRPW